MPSSFRDFYMHVARSVHGSKIIYPDHLQPMIDAMLARPQSSRMVVDAPPRHLKTTTQLIAIVYRMLTEKREKFGHITYSGDLQGENARQYDAYWGAWTSANPGLAARKSCRGSVTYFRSIQGGITGVGFTALVVFDDPIKNLAVALSRAEVDSIWHSFTSQVLTRLQGHCNVLVSGTRWVHNDPQGRCLAMDFEHLHLPAISKTGNALEPRLFDIETLKMKRRELGGETAHEWLALYQGTPPTTTAGFFPTGSKRYTDDRDPQNVTAIDYGFGIDLSYTSGTSSDYCAFSVVRRWSDNTCDLDGFIMRGSIAEFLARVKSELAEIGKTDAQLVWYCDTKERGLAPEICTNHGVRIVPRLSLGKIGNAQRLSAAWRAELVYVPREWVDDLSGGTPLSQLQTFSGRDNQHDDFVDSAAAAYDSVFPRAEFAASTSPVKMRASKYA
jgi:phage terminase large subunit-like protein